MSDIGGFDGSIAYIPCGKHGLIYNPNPNFIPATGLLQAENLSFSDDSIRKLPGRARLSRYVNVPDSPSVQGIYDWHPSEGTQYLVSVSTVAGYYITSSTSTTLNSEGGLVVTGVSSLPSVRFVEAGGSAQISQSAQRYLVVFNGVTAARAFRVGSPRADFVISGVSDWTRGNLPINGTVHNGRLFAWGVSSKPHSLYGSTIDDHVDFVTGVETGVATATSAVYMHVHPGSGIRLYCGHSYKGMLILLKYPRGVFYIDDTDVNPAGWRALQVTDSIGCAPSPHASVLTDDGILFMTPNGRFAMVTASTQGGIEVVDFSTRLMIDTWLDQNVNLVQLSKIASVWNPTTKEAYFAVPSKRYGSGSSVNDLVLIFDFRGVLGTGEGLPRFSYSFRDQVQSFALRRNPGTFVYEVISSDYEGNVWVHNQEARATNQALPGESPSYSGYRATFQTAHSNLADYAYTAPDAGTLAVTNKNFVWLGIEYVPTSAGSVTITTFVDGVQQPSQTADLRQSGPVLAPKSGETVFTIYSGSGSDKASKLSGVKSEELNILVKWVRITGTGRRFSVQIQSSDVALEDLHITGLYVGYTRGGHDVGRGQGSA